MARHNAKIGTMIASRFGGFIKLGVTPAGGFPAGPFRSACIAAWTCSGVGDVAGVAIIVVKRPAFGVVSFRSRILRMQSSMGDLCVEQTQDARPENGIL